MFGLDRRVFYLLVLVAAALVFAGGVEYARLALAPAPAPQVTTGPAAGEASGAAAPEAGSPAGDAEVVVHVTGAVSRPGVYRLPAGARVVEAVEKAGPLPEADLEALNLAARLVDGQKLPVPRQGEEPPPAGSAFSAAPPGDAAAAVTTTLVNINTADVAQLDTLPGIGPALAQRIIQYREQNGPFRVVEDLMNVSGIGEARFQQLKGLITVN